MGRMLKCGVDCCTMGDQQPAGLLLPRLHEESLPRLLLSGGRHARTSPSIGMSHSIGARSSLVAWSCLPGAGRASTAGPPGGRWEGDAGLREGETRIPSGGGSGKIPSLERYLTSGIPRGADSKSIGFPFSRSFPNFRSFLRFTESVGDALSTQFHALWLF
jgi:hypothetical protein